MLHIVAAGFMLGLATAPVCAGVCAPVFLAFALSREERRFSRQARALGAFLGGRLIGYAAVGLFFGWLGSHVAGGLPPALVVVSRGTLGAALLLYAVSQTGGVGGLCLAAERWGREARFPLVLGILTGLTICPPFVAGVERVVAAGGAGLGLAFFLAFFLATTLVMVPMVFASFAGTLPAVRSIGRVACAAAGLVFMCQAAAVFGEMAVPAAAAVTRGGAAPGGVPHRVLSENGRPVAVVVTSEDLAPEVRGYGGHVPVAVTLSLKGEVMKVELLAGHEETPALYTTVAGSDLLRRLTGKKVSDPIAVGRDIDAVSGATSTSKAVVDAVRLTARRAAEEVLPLYGGGEAGAGATGTEVLASEQRRRLYLAGVLAVLLATGAFADLRGVRWLRVGVPAVSFLVLGVWLRTFLSVRHVLDVVMLSFPSFRTHAAWYILIAGALGSSLLAGRVYCAYVCPFGAATELMGRLTRAPLKVGARLDRRLRYVKYAVLVVLAVVYAATRNGRLLAVEPFGDAFSPGALGGESGAALRIGWLAFLLIASGLVMRFFCRYLCPAGAAMAFLARHRLFGRIRPDRCVECGECMVSCPKRKGMP